MHIEVVVVRVIGYNYRNDSRGFCVERQRIAHIYSVGGDGVRLFEPYSNLSAGNAGGIGLDIGYVDLIFNCQRFRHKGHGCTVDAGNIGVHGDDDTLYGFADQRRIRQMDGYIIVLFLSRSEITQFLRSVIRTIGSLLSRDADRPKHKTEGRERNLV